jgi:hypothetical protein
MKQFYSLFIFLFISGWSRAEPLKTVFNPFTGKLDYITRIDSNTVIGGTNCTTTSNSNGTVTVTCASGGGGPNGSVNTASQYSSAYYSVTGSSNVISGLTPGTSGQILSTGGSGSGPFWANAPPGTSPGTPVNSVQYNNPLGTFAGSANFTTDGSSVTVSTMVANNLVDVGPNISITSSTQNMTITNTQATGVFADPEAFTVNGSTNQDSACIGFHVIGEGSGLPGWAQCRDNTALQFGIKSVTGGMNNVMVMDDVNGTTPRITFNNPVYLGNASSLNASGANIQQTSMTVTGRGGLGVNYGTITGSMTVTGANTTIDGVLMTWPSSGTIGNYLQYTSTNTLQWVAASSGGGTVTSVTGTPPINSSGGTTPAISLSQTIGQDETFSGSSVTIVGNGGLGVTYNINVGSMTGAGLSSCSGAANAVTWNSGTDLFGCNTISSSGGSGSGTVNAANQFSIPYYSVAGSSNVLSAYPNVTFSTMTGVNIGTGTIIGAAGYTVSISSNMILGAKTTFYAIGNAVIDGMNFFDNATTTGPYTAYQVNASTPTLTLNSIGIQSGSNQTRCPLDITFPNNQIMDQVQVTGTRNWYLGQFQTVPLLQVYGWLGVGSTPLYEEITSSGTHMFFGQSSSTDTLQFWNSLGQEGSYLDSGGGWHFNGTAAFPNAGNFFNGSVSAGQFYRANLNGTAQLVSYDLLNTTQTWTGLNTYSSPSGLDINYGLLTGTATIYSTGVSSEALVVKSTTGVTAFSVANSSVTPGDFLLTISTGLGVTTSHALTVDTSGNGIFLGNVTSTALGGGGSQCVQVDNSGKFNGSGGSCGGGGGGASSLGVNFNGVSITTPTAQINFVGPGVYVTATGSTATVTVSSWPAGVPSMNSTGNAAITSSVTLNAGSNITLSQLGNTITVASSGGGTKPPISYVLDGAGLVISSATTSLASFYELPYNVTITSVTMSCDSTTSSLSVAVSSQTAANFATGNTPASICASDCPTLSSARREGDGALTGWTTALSQGDYILFDLVGAAPINAKRCILQVWVN